MPVEYAKNDAGHFVCTHKDCNKVFERQNTMYYHIMRHRKQFAYTCADCDKGFIQKSAFLHHMAAIHPGNEITIPDRSEPTTPTVVGTATSTAAASNAVVAVTAVNSIKIKNPYDGQTFTCPCCNHVTRTKANALVHYARLHSKDWIPAYNKDNGCTHCKAKFSSVAAYLYHCTGCMPCNNTHRDMISRMIDKE